MGLTLPLDLQRLRTVPMRILVVGLVGAVVLGYSIMLGLRYWQAVSEMVTLERQEQHLTTGLVDIPFSVEALEARVESQRGWLGDLQARLEPEEPDLLMALVAAEAQRIPVNVASMVAGDREYRTVEDIKYQVQPVAVTLQGSREQIMEFLASLSEAKFPIVVRSLKIGEPHEAASAHAQIAFYMAPEPLEQEVEE